MGDQCTMNPASERKLPGQLTVTKGRTMKILTPVFRFRRELKTGFFPANILLAAIVASSPASENVVKKNAGAFEDGLQTPVVCTGGLKHRVAILSVVNRTPYGQQRIGNAVKDMLTTEISKTGCFVLVEPEDRGWNFHGPAFLTVNCPDNFLPEAGFIVH